MPAKLDPHSPRKILVRGTNWVGDAVMTLPAVAALQKACPQAEITVLAKPWAAPVYGCVPGLKVHEFDSRGRHSGVKGLWTLSRELHAKGFDWAILLQNALQAAIIARMAGIKVRAGYATDARRILLSHALPPHPRKTMMHETSYYIDALCGLGIVSERPPDTGVWPQFRPLPNDMAWAWRFLKERGLDGPLLGLAPGAAFGSAKCWPPDRYAAVARELIPDGFQAALLFGSQNESDLCARVEAGLKGMPVINLAAQSTLGQALALLSRLSMFISNDSGLLHAAAALATPTVAVFGPTNPVTTAPMGPWVNVVYEKYECSPCLKPECPKNQECFDAVTPHLVAEAGRELLATKKAAPLQPVVFLDRDGTINQDIGFACKPSDLHMLPGSAKAIARLNRAGYAVVVLTNQSGIGRGIYNEEAYHLFNEAMDRELAKEGARVDRYYYCPHHPKKAQGPYLVECGCRKPKPGMLMQAAREMSLDLKRAYMVGDRYTDMGCAGRAGVPGVLLQEPGRPLDPTEEDAARPALVAPDLMGAVDWILDRQGGSPA